MAVLLDDHPESCSTASLTSPCLCHCHGSRHGEGRAAARLTRHMVGAQVRTTVPDGQGTVVARPNMRVTENAPAPDRLRAMTEDEIGAMFARYSVEQNWDALAAVDVEMTRREADGMWVTNPHAEQHWNTGEVTEADHEIDALLARGYDFVDAYAEVHGADAGRLRQQERAGGVDRVGAQTTEAALRRGYDQSVYESWLRAETDLRGHLLSRAGKSAGSDPIDLFSGPTSSARKYASEDLQRWWADNGRMTYTQYKASILGRSGDVAAAERTRLGGNARDFI